MERSLPVGWSVHTCNREGDGGELLEGGDPNSNSSTHVCDLFHEDAQVGSDVFILLFFLLKKKIINMFGGIKGPISCKFHFTNDFKQ